MYKNIVLNVESVVINTLIASSSFVKLSGLLIVILLYATKKHKNNITDITNIIPLLNTSILDIHSNPLDQSIFLYSVYITIKGTNIETNTSRLNTSWNAVSEVIKLPPIILLCNYYYYNFLYLFSK